MISDPRSLALAAVLIALAAWLIPAGLAPLLRSGGRRGRAGTTAAAGAACLAAAAWIFPTAGL